ncbi:class I SAM-dependent methyltransferase [Roseofilum sp. BLCC_M91]|uniref:Class I SAM-dependent methyltransferase n=1 Tax=Roseofilum halophilum BLCC-M91 TaxID=3022259 RepID=A0ABT7BIY4_9CYAN|nr:class I SAM-dependent methyltransferase [Roseofilum halophilum]MDJ1178238.1 class I SAM-dependent methyltransferase [Roseofilum halophilum BLCC-M91]
MLKKILNKIYKSVQPHSAKKQKYSKKEKRDFLFNTLPKQSVGAEIGVHEGEFSQQMIEALSPKELHLIDPWEYQDSNDYKDALYGGKVNDGQKSMDERYARVCDKFSDSIKMGQIKIHRGYSTDVLEKFPDEYFDWIYIDGNHLYEYVKADLQLSLRKVKVNGLITGDDCYLGGWWGDGVVKAVNEFSDNGRVKLIAKRYGQFIFAKQS